AVAWYRKAATQALEGNDFDGAIERADRGIASGAQGAELVTLLLIATEAHRWKRDFPAAERTARRAFEVIPCKHPLAVRARGEAALACDLLSPAGLLDVARELLMIPWTAENNDAFIVAIGRACTTLLLAGQIELADALWARVPQEPISNPM